MRFFKESHKFLVAPDFQKKVFIINQGQIEGRIDVEFYSPIFRKKLSKLDHFVNVWSILKSWNRWDWPRNGFYTDDIKNWVLFLRVNNLKNHTIDLNNKIFINRIIHETKLKRAQVKAWDVIFAISWTKDNLWTVSIIPDTITEANLNSALVKMELNEKLINKRFFCLMFEQQVIKDQIKYIGQGAAQNNLNSEEISSIKIPLPSLDVQHKIIEIMDNASNEKENKENESNELFEGIDDFVLSELWVKYEEVEQKKVFWIMLSELLIDNRFDTNYYLRTHRKILKSKYDIWKLSDYATVNKWQSITKVKLSDWNIPVIAWWQSSPYNHWVSNYNWNIITISASWAYSGFVWYHNYPIFASDCSVIYSKDEEKINTEFLACFLKVRQKYIYSLQQGAWQPHVYPSDIKELEVPLPPLKIQEKIAIEVKARVEKANILKAEAIEVYEDAKRKVEEMILGDV